MTPRVILAATHEAAAPEDMAGAHALRTRVFVGEQQVPPDIERDGRDHVCAHVVVYDGDTGVVVGTGRLMEGDGYAKVQRVAVAPEARGTGLGRVVMEGLEELARRSDRPLVKLASQASAIGFYERIGYVAYGEPFMEAGIVHRWMEKRV